MGIEMSSVVPMLKVKNIDETIAFYTNTLGFVVQSRAGGWCCLEWGGARVMFYGMGDLDAPPGPPTMTGVLYFYPSDVRTLWAHLKDRAAVEWELQEMDYGMLEFAIRDCNGYTLSFGQDVEDSE